MIKIKLLILIFICVPTIHVGAQIITTIAGSGLWFGPGNGAFSGDGGPATDAQFFSPVSVVVDSIGNVYVADEFNYRIRKIGTNDTINTIAGNGTSGWNGDNKPATDAEFCDLSYIGLDNNGNLYVPDVCGNGIRKVNLATDTLTTFAGNGTSFCIDDSLATTAAINYPFSIIYGNSGNFYISGACSYIDKISLLGIITRVAGSDSDGGYAGDNGSAIDAKLNHQADIAFDKEGNLYISDLDNDVIRKVDAFGIITTFAGTVGVWGYSGDDSAATSAQLNGPEGIVTDGENNVFFSDCGNMVVRRIDHTTGIITTIAGNGTVGYSGDGFAATAAQLYSPAGLAFDAAGNLLIADWCNNRIRKVSNAGVPLKESEVRRAESGEVSVYPNPAKNQITIDGAVGSEVGVYDIIGQSFINIILQKNNEVVDVSGLPKGIYLVEIIDLKTGYRVVKKILKE